jgi:hypothetical protein
MSKKTNITPSIDEAKLRLQLYNNLCDMLRGLNRRETCKVLNELRKYVKVMHSNYKLNELLFVTLTECATAIFEYLYQTKQLNNGRVGKGFDPEILKNIEDVFWTIIKDYDAD